MASLIVNFRVHLRALKKWLLAPDFYEGREEF